MEIDNWFFGKTLSVLSTKVVNNSNCT
jgi:hypothetical protein